MRLENWIPVQTASGVRLQGELHGHPTKMNGQSCLTSPLCGAHGRVVTTRSGSTYHLGEPLPSWVTLLTAKGETFDAEEPLRDYFPTKDFPRD